MILLVENDYAQLKWQLREQRQEDSCNLSKHSKFHSPEYSQRFWEFVLRRKQAQKLIIEGCGNQICVHVADLVICRVVVDNAVLVFGRTNTECNAQRWWSTSLCAVHYKFGGIVTWESLPMVLSMTVFCLLYDFITFSREFILLEQDYVPLWVKYLSWCNVQYVGQWFKEIWLHDIGALAWISYNSYWAM